MIRLLRVEILKLARRPRTYLGYLGVLLLLVPMLLGLLYGQPDRHLRHEIGADFHVVGTFVNALFMARRMMEPCLWFFLPLFIALVAGDSVAGEAAEEPSVRCSSGRCAACRSSWPSSPPPYSTPRPSPTSWASPR